MPTLVGEPGGGGRHGQLAEQPGADRVQRRGGCLRAFDDLDVLHDRNRAIDKKYCQER